MTRTPAALAATLLLSLAPAVQAAPSADLVLRGGKVHTMDAAHPEAQAIAIRQGAITAVGSDADIAALVGPKTKVIELQGRTVVPGFTDSHAHLLGIGKQRMQLDLVGTKSYAEVLERVKAAVKGHPAGEWIVGRGWHEGKWTEPAPGAVRGFPTEAALSAISPDNPVWLERADGHAILVNARALAAAGVTAKTPVPAGGEIVKDAEGKPTGVLVDNATDLVTPPPFTPEQNRQAVQLAIQECLQKGLTEIHDAGQTPEVIAIYKDLAEQRALDLRLYVMVSNLEGMKAFGAPQVGLGDGMLTVRTVKLYADGALGSRGAALLEPYKDDPGNSGFFVTPPEGIKAAATYAIEHGYQVAVHAIGDRANRMVLDQYQAVLLEHPQSKDWRPRVEHAQILDAADIPRFAKLGVIASMQGIHATSDRPWAGDRLGAERVAEGAYVWQKLLKSGARIANGTDAPVEDVDPIRNFYASVTRQDESGQPAGGFDPDQRMNRRQALRSYTSDAAYAAFEETTRGTIEKGKRADLTVLDQDIMSVPEPDILKTHVDVTIVDGRVRFERPGAIAPTPSPAPIP